LKIPHRWELVALRGEIVIGVRDIGGGEKFCPHLLHLITFNNI